MLKLKPQAAQYVRGSVNEKVHSMGAPKFTANNQYLHICF